MDITSQNVDEKYTKIIRNELEYNLYQVKDFRILEREKIDIIIQENKIRGIETNKQSEQISIGKTLFADFILAGEIQRDEQENKFLINLRIISVDDGTVLYFYPRKIDDVSEIKNFTKSISDTIANDLTYFNTYGRTKDNGKIITPSPVREEKKKSNRKIDFIISPEYIYPLGGFSNIVKMGYGINFYIGANDIFSKNMNIGFETGLIKLDHKHTDSYYFIEVPFLLKIKYIFSQFGSLYISPELKAGPGYFYYRQNNKENVKDNPKSAIEIISQAGIAFEKKISEKFNISISLSYGAIFEKESVLSFITAHLGIGYSF